MCIVGIAVFSSKLSAAERTGSRRLAATAQPSVQILPAGVSVHQLDNGMRVLLIENPALPMVGVNVVIKVGSAYETFATSGMSHMLEHLLFNGTTTRTQKKLYDDTDRIGGYNNANTSEYFTNFMMVTPAEHIQKGMEIQADMLFNSTLPAEKLEKEKGIVLEEISKSLANPHEQFERNTISILYDRHALSLPTLGTYATIESMSRDGILSFYRNNYVPNNMILSAIGNFQTEELLGQIKEIYGNTNPGEVRREVNSSWNTGFETPGATGREDGRIYHRFYDGEDTKVQMFYRMPPFESAEFIKLMGIVLGKNQERIQTALKSEFPEIVKAAALSSRYSPIASYLEITVSLEKAASIDAITRSISIQLSKLNFALPDETVRTEISKTRTSFLKNIEKPHMFGIYNASVFAMSGIETVLSSYSGDGYYPAADQLKSTRFSTPSVILIQYPSNRQTEEKDAASNRTDLFNDSGTALIAVQNDASNLLAVHYMLKHKAYYESKYGKGSAKLLHECLGLRLKSEVSQKISNRFGLTYVVNDNPYIPMDDIYLHPDFSYLRVEGLADDLPGAIEYLNEQLSDFLPTEEEFNTAVGKIHGAGMMMMGGNKTKELFDETYRSVIYEPASYADGPEDITIDNLKAFAKEYFRPVNMIISVVSPASPDSINSLFTPFFGDPAEEEPPVYVKTLKTQTEPLLIEKDGEGERSYLFWGFTREIDPAHRPELTALSLILSDIIVFDIREKQGMAYRMRAGIDQMQDKAVFYVRMGTRPQNVDTLLEQYPGFFKTELLDSVTKEDFEKSINMYLGRMMFRRLSSINQAYYLAHSLYFYGDVDHDKKFLEELKSVTLENTKMAAKTYLVADNPVSVIVH